MVSEIKFKNETGVSIAEAMEILSKPRFYLAYDSEFELTKLESLEEGIESLKDDDNEFTELLLVRHDIVADRFESIGFSQDGTPIGEVFK